MAKKEEYKIKNQEFLKEISAEEGVVTHPSGILYYCCPIKIYLKHKK